MTITLYMAVSIDGCITRGADNSDWVSPTDWDQFNEYVQASDAVIMGRKTMQQFESGDFPIQGPANIVLSRNPQLHQNSEKLVIMEGKPEYVAEMARTRGWNNLLLIGGAEINAQFLQADMIDDIILSVHPLVIGQGLHVFGDQIQKAQLQVISTYAISNELVQIHYRVIRSA